MFKKVLVTDGAGFIGSRRFFKPNLLPLVEESRPYRKQK
jgi:hypothetical protein